MVSRFPRRRAIQSLPPAASAELCAELICTIAYLRNRKHKANTLSDGSIYHVGDPVTIGGTEFNITDIIIPPKATKVTGNRRKNNKNPMGGKYSAHGVVLRGILYAEL
jgi:hypothetical protein